MKLNSTDNHNRGRVISSGKTSAYLLFAVFAMISACTGEVLPVPETTQENPNWCWAACSQMVLSYYGVGVSQTEIASFGVGINSATGKPFDVYNFLNGNQSVVSADTNLPKQSVSTILKHYAKLVTSYDMEPPSITELTDAIDDKSPVILRYAIGLYNDSTGGYDYDFAAHMVVLYGYNGDSFYVHNPSRSVVTQYPRNDVGLSSGNLIAGQFTIPGLGGGKCSYKLTNALFIQSADLALLFDSTGSMEPELDSVKQQALNIVDLFKQRYSNPRVSVADYKDNPDYGGDSGDYVYRADSMFTDDASAVNNAIAALEAGGGGDTPESLFSALAATIDGGSNGGFRTGSVDRNIYVFTDAIGKSPEPWPGGMSMNDVVAKAKAKDIKINTFPCVVNSSGSASVVLPNRQRFAKRGVAVTRDETTDDTSPVAQLKSLSDATGGFSKTLQITDGVLAESALIKGIDKSILSTRTPKGETSLKRPFFSFQEQSFDMTTVPAAWYIQIQKLDSNTGAWVDISNGLQTLVYADHWQPNFNIHKGKYRWRLCHSATKPLPLFQNGDGLKETSTDLVCEGGWTNFSRIKTVTAPSP